MRPQTPQEVILGNFWWADKGWRVGVVNLAVLACVSRMTTEKVIKFLRKKRVHPQRKSWLRLWERKRLTDGEHEWVHEVERGDDDGADKSCWLTGQREAS